MPLVGAPDAGAASVQGGHKTRPYGVDCYENGCAKGTLDYGGLAPPWNNAED